MANKSKTIEGEFRSFNTNNTRFATLADANERKNPLTARDGQAYLNARYEWFYSAQFTPTPKQKNPQ
jgi:hypothetical protein